MTAIENNFLKNAFNKQGKKRKGFIYEKDCRG